MKDLLPIAASIAALALIAPAGAASHVDPGSSIHRTYELGPPGDFLVSDCVTGDERTTYWRHPLDVSAAGAPASDASGPEAPQASCDPAGQTQDGSIDVGGAVVRSGDVPDGVRSLQTDIVDDVFGADAVGGLVCNDRDGDLICGETADGELRANFCGTTPPLTIPPPRDWHAVVVFVNGPVAQTIDCDAAAAPTATTGGVLDPAAGIFLAFD